MVFFRLLIIKDTSGMNLSIPPQAFGQKLSDEYGKEDNKNQIMYLKEYNLLVKKSAR